MSIIVIKQNYPALELIDTSALASESAATDCDARPSSVTASRDKHSYTTAASDCRNSAVFYTVSLALQVTRLFYDTISHAVTNVHSITQK